MKRRIRHISPHQTGKVMAIVYAIPSLLFVPLVLLAEPVEGETPFPKALALLLPPLFVVFAYVSFAFMALVYNLAAGWVGGIEVTFDGDRTDVAVLRVRRAPAEGGRTGAPPEDEE